MALLSTIVIDFPQLILIPTEKFSEIREKVGIAELNQSMNWRSDMKNVL